MRILQVNSVFNGGGVDNQTLELCKGLLALGDEVTLAIPPAARVAALAHAVPGLRVELLPGGKLPWACKLAALVRQRRIDIVHAHHGRDNWVACAAARLGGIGDRTVISRHLMTPLSPGSARYLLRFAHVAAVSRAVHRVLDGQLIGPRARLHLVYGGVDTAVFNPAGAAAGQALRRELGWPEQAVVFSVVGSLNPPRGKGQLEFVEAAAQVHAQLPDTRFLIAGDGRLDVPVRALAAQLGIGDAVRLLPFRPDIAPVHHAADVLVHPATGSEALGLVIWEAMACGKPVIASRLDGIPEAFVEERHGLLVPPGDVPALAAAMLRLGADPALRARMGQAAAAYVEQEFSARRYAGRMHALYAAIVGG
ncbi:MAG: glycosyltransferase family 4 protein [Nevskia sp.]|nr:glycosyltransferase family 4 protein [Nevskia sp.]